MRMSEEGDGTSVAVAAEGRQRTEQRDAFAAVVPEAQSGRVGRHSSGYVRDRTHRACQRGRATSFTRRVARHDERAHAHDPRECDRRVRERQRRQSLARSERLRRALREHAPRHEHDRQDQQPAHRTPFVATNGRRDVVDPSPWFAEFPAPTRRESSCASGISAHSMDRVRAQLLDRPCVAPPRDEVVQESALVLTPHRVAHLDLDDAVAVRAGMDRHRLAATWVTNLMSCGTNRRSG